MTNLSKYKIIKDNHSVEFNKRNGIEQLTEAYSSTFKIKNGGILTLSLVFGCGTVYSRSILNFFLLYRNTLNNFVIRIQYYQLTPAY